MSTANNTAPEMTPDMVELARHITSLGNVIDAREARGNTRNSGLTRRRRQLIDKFEKLADANLATQA